MRNNYEYKKLYPFKWFILQNFPFIEDSIDALTNYQLFCKLGDMINKQNDAINSAGGQVEILTNSFNDLYDYVHDYFDNLDVQDEINNKLDDMAQSGELNALIKKLDYYEITDETEDEIQDIFDLETAKVISFKNDYTFTETHILNENTTILLNNNTITFDVPSYTEDWTKSHGFFNFKDTDAFTDYDGNCNISIIGGTIVGGNISFCHAKNINIIGIDFVNCVNNHIVEMAGVSDLHINNCTFKGIPLSNDLDVNYLEYIQMDYMQYNDFPWFNENSSTYDGTINKKWIIENCQFIKPNNVNFTYYNAIGFHNYIENEDPENIKIQNNLFENMGNSGIVLYAMNNCEIKNNTFIKDDYSSEIEGSYIVLKNIGNNIYIKDNIFTGGYKAIECQRLHKTKNNIIISGNKFNTFNHGSNAIVRLYNINDSKIYNNMFNEFTNAAIRVDAQINDGNYSGDYYIFNNHFVSSLTLTDGTIKTYQGEPHIYDNTFKCTSTGSNYAIQLPAVSDATLTMAYIKRNEFISGYSEKYLLLNGNDPTNIYNIYISAYSGNVASLTNQTLNADIMKFNRARLMFGSGAGTTIKILRPWTPADKLTDRTYRFLGCASDNSSFGMTFTINNDENHTVTYATSSSSTLANIRTIFLYNE